MRPMVHRMDGLVGIVEIAASDQKKKKSRDSGSPAAPGPGYVCAVCLLKLHIHRPPVARSASNVWPSLFGWTRLLERIEV
jgi:hypothetical protein